MAKKMMIYQQLSYRSYDDGSYQLSGTTLDLPSGRMVPRTLDAGELDPSEPFEPWEMLLIAAAINATHQLSDQIRLPW